MQGAARQRVYLFRICPALRAGDDLGRQLAGDRHYDRLGVHAERARTDTSASHVAPFALTRGFRVENALCLDPSANERD